mgnify:CR=1 FL=1
MKNKKLMMVASLLSLVSLAGCGNTSESVKPSEPAKPTVEDTAKPSDKEFTADDAKALIAAYNPSLTGKASFTYTANYKVDVDAHGGTGKRDNFKHEIEDTTTGYIDRTAGNVYLKISKTSKDKKLSNDAKTTEALVYKDGDTYKYVTTTRENPVTLANEDAAIAKISTLVTSISYNLAGSISRDTFKYQGENQYEWREFGLSSTAISAEECNEPYSYTKKEDGGLEIKTKVQYVGYKTDNGISDFSNKTDEYAAEAVVNTTSTGLVTSYTETYNNASLDFAIRTPAPTVIITGSRNFTANYSASFTKAETIEHHLTKSVITWDNNPKCDFEVYSCSADDKEHKTAIKSGDEVKVGDLLAVKVTPVGKNNVVNVSLGTTSAEKSDDGFYYFEVTEGDKKLSANINGSDRKADVKYATVTTEKGEHVKSFKVQYRTYSSDKKETTDLDEQNRAPIGESNFLVLTAEFDEGYELDAFTVNGNAATNFGQWCYAIKTEGTYACKVTAKAVSTTPVSKDVEFTLSKDAGVKSATVSTRDSYNPSTITDVTAAGKAEAKAGRLFCVKVELNEGYQLDLVKSGKVVAGFRNQYYYFTFEAGTHAIDIVTRTATPAIQYVNFKIVKDDGVKSVSVWSLDKMNFAGRMDYTNAKKAEAKDGRFLCVKVELKDGFTVESVKSGETSGNLQSGYYCFDGSKAGEVTYTIVTKAATAA